MTLKFKIRTMREEDIPASLNLMTSHGMFLGLYEAKTWIQLDPEGLLVAEELETGRVLGQISGINYDKNNSFIGMYTVLEEFRLQGIGSALWNALMLHCNGRNIGLYARVQMVPSYQKRGFTLTSPYDLKIYVGNPKTKIHSIDGVIIEKIDEKNINQVNKYDQKVCGIDRSQYNCLNANETEAVSLVALKQDTKEAVGYCILKKGNKFRIIAPLYADSDEIAELLIAKCEISEGEQISIRTLDGSAGVDLVDKISMDYVTQVPTLFSKEIVIPDMKKVYSGTSINYFPF